MRSGVSLHPEFIVVHARWNADRALNGMRPSKTTVSHVLRGKFGQADDPAGSAIKLLFDASRYRSRPGILKPTASFNLLVDPIAPRVENVRETAKDVGDTGKESAEIASAVKQVRSFPNAPQHCRHRQDVLDDARTSPPIGSMLPANAAGSCPRLDAIRGVPIGRLWLERENRAFPTNGLQTRAHGKHLRLTERCRESVEGQVCYAAAQTLGAVLETVVIVHHVRYGRGSRWWTERSGRNRVDGDVIEERADIHIGASHRAGLWAKQPS